MNKKIQKLTYLMVFYLIISANQVFFVYAASDSWTRLEPMPTARTTLGVAVVNGKIYAIGGYGAGGYLNVNEEYDPATNTWTTKEPMPIPRASFGIAVVENKIYVIGGVIGYDVDAEGIITCSINQVYDPLTDTWETMEPMPTNRSQLNANVLDGKVYMIGGRTGGQYTTVALNQVYDPETDTWTTKTSIPYPVVRYASAVVDDKIYIISGQNEFHSLVNLNFTQIYDPENDVWSQGAQMPVVTTHAAADATTGVFAPKRIYVIGGEGGFVYPLDQNYVYDSQADVWITGTPMPTSRSNPAVAVVNDLVYVIGGTVGWLEYTATLERYTPIEYIPEFQPWMPWLVVIGVLSITLAVFKTRLTKIANQHRGNKN